MPLKDPARVTDQQIRAYLRRFEPATTSQIRSALYCWTNSLPQRLAEMPGVRRDGAQGNTFLWSCDPDFEEPVT